MKHTFQWLLAAVCILIASSTQMFAEGEKKEEEKKVSIPLITVEPISGDEKRTCEIVPFTAYYQGSAIYISTSAEFSTITINVENETTDQVWNSTTDVSDGMGEISITNAGSGSYRVEIITEYGECFTGNFRL